MAFTYFFRDMHVLDLAVRHLVPYASGRSRVRIWDAGCAMGPEPYSLAIMLAESMGRFGFRNVSIIASDIDESGGFDKIIAEGVYPEEPLSRIPEDIFKKYFQPNGRPGFFRIDENIKKSVSFMRHDLLSLKPIGDDFSLIICKNVLLHFQPAERVEVIRMFHRSLAHEGLFVTEQTQKMPEEAAHLFEQVVSDGQVHRKVEGGR